MPIHPSAVVDQRAELDPTVEVGPFCVIGPHVKIGPHTRLHSHVVVDNRTTLGANNVIHSFAVIGGAPQDLKYKGEAASLVIGDNNVFREAVTVNIGTASGHMETRIGNHCLFMAYSHIAHDCQIGDHVVADNSVALAGHVDVDDYAIISGLAGVHQFCRIGRRAFVAAGAMVARDVLPFCIAIGDRAELAGLNVVGLRRAGFTREQLSAMRQTFKLIFDPAITREQALQRCEAEIAPQSAEAAEMCAFIRSAKRGICSARTNASTSDEFE